MGWRDAYSLLKYLWILLFARPQAARLNKLLFRLSLHGLGILNYKSNYISGERAWLKSALCDLNKPVVLDVGANVGDYSAMILEANSSAIIYAFEPHPKNVTRLKSRFGANWVGVIVPSAVGNVRGSLDLYDYLDKDGSSHASLYKEVIEEIHGQKSVKHSVEVLTIDDFCRDSCIEHIDLLKIDTEGNELKCLQGARRMLESGAIDAIHFEFNEMNVISHATFKDFWDILNGYSFARLLPGGQKLPIDNYSALECELYAYQNIIALRKV